MGTLTSFGEDISNDSYKISKTAFKDMVRRRDEWNTRTGLEPNFVRLPKPHERAYVTCGVTGGRMDKEVYLNG